MTIKEISTFLAVSPSTIDRRISEAKTRLREEILAMMNTAGERYELPSAFTFNIIEIVKNIRIKPISPTKPLPLGLSLATGLVLLFFGIGSNMFLPSPQAIPESSVSSNAMLMSYIKSMQVAFSDIPKSSYDFIGGGDDKGNRFSGQQNNALMAPKGEGGKIPDKPSFQLGKGTAQKLAFSPDGSILAIGGGLGIRLYDADNLNEVCFFQEGSTSIAISPDSKILASCNRGKTIQLWSIPDQKQIGLLEGHTEGVFNIAFSPDSKILASGSYDKTVRLWDIQTQKEIGILQGHKEVVTALTFTPDGKTLATGGMDKIICIWDIQTQKQIGELKGHKDGIYSLAFSPDEKLLASGGRWESKDKVIRLWDVKELKQIGLLEGHK
jgi:WD40 repeat protein